METSLYPVEHFGYNRAIPAACLVNVRNSHLLSTSLIFQVKSRESRIKSIESSLEDLGSLDAADLSGLQEMVQAARDDMDSSADLTASINLLKTANDQLKASMVTYEGRIELAKSKVNRLRDVLDQLS